MPQSGKKNRGGDFCGEAAKGKKKISRFCRGRSLIVPLSGERRCFIYSSFVISRPKQRYSEKNYKKNVIIYESFHIFKAFFTLLHSLLLNPNLFFLGGQLNINIAQSPPPPPPPPAGNSMQTAINIGTFGSPFQYFQLPEHGGWFHKRLCRLTYE